MIKKEFNELKKGDRIKTCHGTFTVVENEGLPLHILGYKKGFKGHDGHIESQKFKDSWECYPTKEYQFFAPNDVFDKQNDKFQIVISYENPFTYADIYKNGKFIAKGTAKKHPLDINNNNIGSVIAVERAWKKYYAIRTVEILQTEFQDEEVEYIRPQNKELFIGEYVLSVSDNEIYYIIGLSDNGLVVLDNGETVSKQEIKCIEKSKAVLDNSYLYNVNGEQMGKIGSLSKTELPYGEFLHVGDIVDIYSTAHNSFLTSVIIADKESEENLLLDNVADWRKGIGVVGSDCNDFYILKLNKSYLDIEKGYIKNGIGYGVIPETKVNSFWF